MNAIEFTNHLIKLNACSEARQWAEGKSLVDAWDQCNDPQWMMWLLGRSTVNKKVIATIAVEFAEQCVHNASEYPDVAKCIEVAKRFLAGDASREELSAAWSAARSAAAAAESAWSAAWSAAARSAAAAAESAWSAAESTWSAAAAAESA